MGWIASLGVAILTSIVTLFGAGTLASLVVDWYNVSSFEGGAGFFVVAMALLGALAGFVIGLVASRVVAGFPRPGFVKALAGSIGGVAVILGAISGASWIFADIPPRIDNEKLWLLAEVRWPGVGATAPASLSGVPFLRIGAMQGRTARRFEAGLLLVEDARQEDGRWIVLGAVPVFTRRGARLLEFGADGKSLAAFEVPLPRNPGEAELAWSAWLPAALSAEPALAEQFTYRFKVIRRSQPLRTERIGPFQVDTIARDFYYVSDGARPAVDATFRVRQKGEPIPEIPGAETVAVLGGTRPALFVVARATEGTPCAVVADEQGTVRVHRIDGCTTPVTVNILTGDQAHFTAARSHQPVAGWIDRMSFARPGLFKVGAAILDSRDLTTTALVFPEGVQPETGVPPLDLSPDERSFAWLAQGFDQEPRLGVTNWETGETYILPIERTRMRFNTASKLDPRWVQHHFHWTRAPTGFYVLTARRDFVVLPYQGDLELGRPGEYQGYALRPGGKELRAAVVDILVRDLGGLRLPAEPDDFQLRVTVDGKTVSVSVIGSPSYVTVSMDAPQGDPQAMSAIGAKLDAALRSGKYDSLFVVTREN
jgi:hypothetical protein